MKKIVSIAFACMIVAACSGGKSKYNVALEGEIVGLGNDTLLLCSMDGPREIDTIVTKADKFSTRLAVDTITEYNLLFSDGTDIPLFLDKGDKVVLKIQDKNRLPDGVSIAGSPISEELLSFIGSVSDEAMTDSVRREEAVQFINTHLASPLGVYVLRNYICVDIDRDDNLVRQLIQSLNGEMQSYLSIQQLQGEIDDAAKNGIRKTAPTFFFRNQEGKRVTRLKDYKDQYILLHLWASWDARSRAVNKSEYASLYKKYKNNKHVAMLGVSLDVDRQAWIEAVKEDTLTWPQANDPKGWTSTFVKDLGIVQLPANLIISDKGTLVAKNSSLEELTTKIDSIISLPKFKK